jgi:dihydroneopterin aldolase
MFSMADDSHFEPRCLSASVFVRALKVEAEIGVHAHERGRRQALLIDVEVFLAHSGSPVLADTIDYETIVGHAHAIADTGHIGLIETFAWRLAGACLAEPKARRVRVRVEKPLALAPAAEAGGVEITLAKD